MIVAMATLAETFALALQHHQAGRLHVAEPLYRQILAIDPHHAAALHLWGVVALQTNRPQEATDRIARAIQLNDREAIFHNNLGNAHVALGQSGLAVDCYHRAVLLDPRYCDAHINLGIALEQLGNNQRSAVHFRRAVELKPEFAEAHVHLGKSLQEQGNSAEAADCYRHACRLKPDHLEALQQLARLSKALGNTEESLACFRRIVELTPGDVEAYFNLGRAAQVRGKLDEAVHWYQMALQIKPYHAEAVHNLGHAFKVLGQMDEAARCYRQAVDLQPENLSAVTSLTHALQQACDWREVMPLAERVVALVERAAPDELLTPAPPFFFLALPVSTTAEQQLRCARQWVTALRRTSGSRIIQLVKLALHTRRGHGNRSSRSVTSDFHAHATAFLMAELLEKHDRERFTIVGYSYGPDDRSPMRARLVSGLDRFVDITDESPAASAERIATDEIDILVDLKGYTQGARTPLLALRPRADSGQLSRLSRHDGSRRHRLHRGRRLHRAARCRRRIQRATGLPAGLLPGER